MAADMLVKLYELPPIEDYQRKMEQQHILIRRPIGPENLAVMGWIRDHFSATWAGEAENAFFRSPKGMFVAINEDSGEMVGFACYDATVKGFFGPTGVDEKERGKGIGATLLLKCLYAMLEEGYAYAVIGDAGPMEFYKKLCGAIPIADSVPGIYKGMLTK